MSQIVELDDGSQRQIFVSDLDLPSTATQKPRSVVFIDDEVIRAR
jgi:hypothetical protein